MGAVEHFKIYHTPTSILDDAAKGYTNILHCEDNIIATGTLVEGYIKRVFVQPTLQRKGLGKIIMKNLEAKACVLGLSEVKLCSSTCAEDFYLSLGYQIKEREHIPLPDNDRLDYANMYKTL